MLIYDPTGACPPPLLTQCLPLSLSTVALPPVIPPLLTPLSLVAPLYVMIPPASSAEILQAMGQTRPIAPKTSSSSPPMGLPEDLSMTGGDV